MDYGPFGVHRFDQGLIWLSFEPLVIFEACGAHFPMIVGPHVDTFIRGNVAIVILLFSFFIFSFVDVLFPF